jgi:hypothetical protein
VERTHTHASAPRLDTDSHRHAHTPCSTKCLKTTPTPRTLHGVIISNNNLGTRYILISHIHHKAQPTSHRARLIQIQKSASSPRTNLVAARGELLGCSGRVPRAAHLPGAAPSPPPASLAAGRRRLSELSAASCCRRQCWELHNPVLGPQNSPLRSENRGMRGP